MKKLLMSILMAVVLLGLMACTQPVAGEVVQSDKQRVTSPGVSEADLSALVGGNSAFAFDLYQALRETDGNIFYSPYSISLALAMTYAGARGETAQQMSDTLHYVLPQKSLHPAFNSLDLGLSRRGEGAKGKDDKGFRLDIVNAIWCVIICKNGSFITSCLGCGNSFDFEATLGRLLGRGYEI